LTNIFQQWRNEKKGPEGLLAQLTWRSMSLASSETDNFVP